MFKKGYKQSKEHTEKIRLSQLGKKRPNQSNENNCNWKGDNAKYAAIHMWVVSHRGKPTKCEHCGVETLNLRQYNWANIDHLYKRNLDDYMRLCASCHQKYDIEKNQYCGGKRNIISS